MPTSVGRRDDGGGGGSSVAVQSGAACQLSCPRRQRQKQRCRRHSQTTSGTELALITSNGAIFIFTADGAFLPALSLGDKNAVLISLFSRWNLAWRIKFALIAESHT